jgi:hypothetical protein
MNIRIKFTDPTRSASIRIIFFLFVFLVPAGKLYPQSNVIDRAEDIRRAIQLAEYGIAADLADSAIAHFADYPPKTLAEIHTLRALIASENGDHAYVGANFLAALQLNREHKLDPIFFSPALQERFEQLRATVAKRDQQVRVETRYIMLPDPRVSAAWRSLLVPGWGQRYKGQKLKGDILTFTTAALAGATVVSHFLRRNAEQKYLDAGEATVAERYQTFNRYHILRKNFALALGVVWSAAIFDALVLQPPPPPNSNAAFIPRLQALPSGVEISLRLAF